MKRSFYIAAAGGGIMLFLSLFQNCAKTNSDSSTGSSQYTFDTSDPHAIRDVLTKGAGVIMSLRDAAGSVQLATAYSPKDNLTQIAYSNCVETPRVNGSENVSEFFSQAGKTCPFLFERKFPPSAMQAQFAAKDSSLEAQLPIQRVSCQYTQTLSTDPNPLLQFGSPAMGTVTSTQQEHFNYDCVIVTASGVIRMVGSKSSAYVSASNGNYTFSTVNSTLEIGATIHKYIQTQANFNGGSAADYRFEGTATINGKPVDPQLAMPTGDFLLQGYF